LIPYEYTLVKTSDCQECFQALGAAQLVGMGIEPMISSVLYRLIASGRNRRVLRELTNNGINNITSYVRLEHLEEFKQYGIDIRKWDALEGFVAYLESRNQPHATRTAVSRTWNNNDVPSQTIIREALEKTQRESPPSRWPHILAINIRPSAHILFNSELGPYECRNQIFHGAIIQMCPQEQDIY